MSRTYIVTGGAGFIGSNLVHALMRRPDARVVVLDLLTYAGNLDNLTAVVDNPRYHFVHGDICDAELVERLFSQFQPDCVLNLAAESHVDRSIEGPGAFIRTNVTGTYQLLQAARAYWQALSQDRKDAFRFIHVSTDEVYGSLGPDGYFTEESPYAPNSPYAASKAGADHIARAYFHTYGLPTITTNCSNNYGPYQFPEKLLPLVILNALEGKPLPIYGDGKNIRDWLFVEDHCQALMLVADGGRPGESYNVGGHNERTTTQIVESVCDVLDQIVPCRTNAAHAARAVQVSSYRGLIRYVEDRPGHDRRYAIDPAKIQRELGWQQATAFDDGIRSTIEWYLNNKTWCDRITQGVYQRERLGLARSSA